MKALWKTPKVLNVTLKGVGVRRKGELQVKVSENSIVLKKGALEILKGEVDKGHFVFKVFPSNLFLPTSRPFDRNQKFDLSKGYIVFFNRFYSVAIYFKRTVKVYTDAVDVNYHIATPAVDFLVSFGETPLESVKELRKVIKYPKNVLGTFLDVNALSEDSKLAVGDFQGDGLYVKKGENAFKSISKIIAGPGKAFDINTRTKWKILKNSSYSELFTSSLFVLPAASSFLISPVYITENFDINKKRWFIQNAEIAAYEKDLPPLMPIFFKFSGDKNTWQEYGGILIGENIIYISSEMGEKVRNVYFPEGKWLNIEGFDIFEGGKFFKTETDSIYLKENSFAFKRNGGEIEIIVFLAKDSYEFEMDGIRWLIDKEKITAESFANKKQVFNLIIVSQNFIKEISLRLDEGSKYEVKF